MFLWLVRMTETQGPRWAIISRLLILQHFRGFGKIGLTQQRM
jgi:hypothetical protein